MSSPKMQGYVAVVLSRESIDVLRPLAIHPTVHAHHLTLAYAPTEEVYQRQYQTLLGQEIALPVIGIAQDASGQALMIQLPPTITCENQYPHITISCAAGVNPMYSNELLEKGPKKAFQAMLVGRIEFVPFKR